MRGCGLPVLHFSHAVQLASIMLDYEVWKTQGLGLVKLWQRRVPACGGLEDDAHLLQEGSRDLPL